MEIISLIQGLDIGRIVLIFIDIGIVAFVLYKLLMLIKGTKAVRLLKGLLALGAFYLLSDKIGLTTIDWIFEKAGIAILIAVPVVFQPELRKLLEQLGRGQVFGKPFRFFEAESDLSKMIDELVRAVDMFILRRIGALIVIERRTGLKEYVEMGTPIDGFVSAELLLNIFFPYSPLHDGAVIIRGSRLISARNFLPLTVSPFLSRELGTRHRAAIGITEESDAVAVVVSEETGGISLAFEGKLVRQLDEKRLYEMLRELLLEESAEKRRPRSRRARK